MTEGKDYNTNLLQEGNAYNDIYKQGNRNFWAKGDYVSTVGLNQKTIENYIRSQETEDKLRDEMTKREYIDPFKG